jgi:hypothetical protein
MALLWLAAGVFVLVGTTRMVRKGTIKWGYRHGGGFQWSRTDSPFNFWGYAVLYYLWGIAVIASVLYHLLAE